MLISPKTPRAAARGVCVRVTDVARRRMNPPSDEEEEEREEKEDDENDGEKIRRSFKMDEDERGESGRGKESEKERERAVCPGNLSDATVCRRMKRSR